MKRGLCLFALCAVGCTNGLTTPTEALVTQAPTPVPVVHNIPATLPNGVVMWVCATQLRWYCKDGVCEKTVDHYIQPNPCPEVPID